jgi:hypothetical protein
MAEQFMGYPAPLAVQYKFPMSEMMKILNGAMDLPFMRGGTRVVPVAGTGYRIITNRGFLRDSRAYARLSCIKRLR